MASPAPLPSVAPFAIRRMCHVNSLFNADTYARAELVMMSVSDPDPENFFSRSRLVYASITALSFGPSTVGTTTTRVLARASMPSLTDCML